MMMKKLILMAALCMLFVSIKTDAQDLKNAVGIRVGSSMAITNSMPSYSAYCTTLGASSENYKNLNYDINTSLLWGLEYERQFTDKHSAIVSISNQNRNTSGIRPGGTYPTRHAIYDSDTGEIIEEVIVDAITEHKLSYDINVLSLGLTYSFKPFSKFGLSIFAGGSYSMTRIKNLQGSYNLITPKEGPFKTHDENGLPLKHDPTPNDDENGDEYTIPNYENREEDKVYWAKDYRSIIYDNNEKINASYFGILTGVRYEFIIADVIGIVPMISYQFGLEELDKLGLKNMNNINLGCSFRYHF
jgi:hypothetical protein